MSDILLTKNHIIHSIKDEQGNRDIFYAQNTIQDVLIDEDATEDIRGHIIYYGICGTAANDAHKTISVVDGKANVLKNGVQLNITFAHGNSVAPIMLSVNGSPEYTIEGVMESSIVANQTMILIFTGTAFITGGSGGVSITKEEVLGKDPNRTRYLSFVDGATGNADFKIDEKVKLTKEGLATEVGNSTVDFPVDNPQLTTDVRASYTPAPKESFKVIMKKIRHIIDAFGKLAFKDSVGTSELNQQLKDHYNLTVHKSGSINGSSVNDLYNGTDYNSTVGVKALDAKVGKTLQDQITSLNSKITTSLNNDYYTKTEIDTNLGGYYTKTEVNNKVDAKQDKLGYTPAESMPGVLVGFQYDRGLYAYVGGIQYGILLGHWMLKRRRITMMYQIPDPGLAKYLTFTYNFEEREATFGVVGFGAGSAWIFCTDIVACNDKLGMNVCNMGSGRNQTLEAWIEFLTYCP